MGENQGDVELECARSNLELFLRMVWQDDLISEGTYWTFLRRVRLAGSLEGLLAIARELRVLVGRLGSDCEPGEEGCRVAGGGRF